MVHNFKAFHPQNLVQLLEKSIDVKKEKPSTQNSQVTYVSQHKKHYNK